ncbi:DUF2267 domain-containing protein [Streptomyces lasalocidi]|uniref:DUF2267 domain-containing protein n=1 Tax=Streptomyces lasalocidi TaxID=324833 RepID=A0A4U5WGD1_STRLS|nr:DUF2267 domain-containing protein [Streptomyces lasalocidi]
MTVTSTQSIRRTVIPAPVPGPSGPDGSCATAATAATGTSGRWETPDTAAGRSRAWTRLVDEVREAGQYRTTAEADRVTRIVLSALGGHVVGDERVALAQVLPPEAARVVASQIPVTRPQTAAEFVDGVAARIEGATPATARWDVSSVLSVLPKMVGDDLIDRVLGELPPGYALLFGKAELVPPAAR